MLYCFFPYLKDLISDVLSQVAKTNNLHVDGAALHMDDFSLGDAIEVCILTI